MQIFNLEENDLFNKTETVDTDQSIDPERQIQWRPAIDFTNGKLHIFHCTGEEFLSENESDLKPKASFDLMDSDGNPLPKAIQKTLVGQQATLIVKNGSRKDEIEDYGEFTIISDEKMTTGILGSIDLRDPKIIPKTDLLTHSYLILIEMERVESGKPEVTISYNKYQLA